MDVFLSPWQTKVWNDTHRFRVVCAGRRSGKSVLSQLQILTWANTEVGRYWIVAPTYKQAKTIHWEGIQHYVPQKLVSKKNEVELSLTLVNGSVIELRGAENPDALRGVKLRGIVVDEIASIRNWDWLWSEVLRPTLTDYEAPALFISTPKGFNHFHDLYSKGQTGMDNYKSWRFTTYDNPYIPKGEIDHAKQELTEDTFAQEYMADFRRHTGIAHKPWDRAIHLLDEFEIPSTWLAARGFDFGELHFTASVRARIDQDDNWFIDRCYLNNTANVKQHAEVILAEDYGMDFVPKWGDPSGKQWILDFGLHGVTIQIANKEVGQGFKGWVEYCVERVNERLKPVPGHTVRLPNGKIIENAPRMFVVKNGFTDKFIAQIEMLSWKETATGELMPLLEETGDPTGGHYDLMAALRYFAVSYKKQEPAYKPLPNDISRKNWSLQ